MEKPHDPSRIICAGRVITALFFVAFFAESALFLWASYRLLLKFWGLSALFFLLLTLLRRLCKCPRPYQADKRPAPRRGRDDSFPSRHTYSAFFLSCTAFHFAALAGYCLLPLAIALAVLRVKAGVHYPRDVIAGAFLGVIAATVTLLLL
jgi:membrane-associated phospholipid phosphatase